MLFVCDRKKDTSDVSSDTATGTFSVWISLAQVLTNRQNWMAALFNALLFGPALAFSSFWNFPYQKTFGHDAATSVMINNMILLGLAVGGPLIGWISDKTKRRVLPAQLFCVGSLACMLLIISDFSFSITPVFVLMFLYGVCSNGTTVGYAFAKENTAAENQGTVTGFINTLTFISITVLQILPGTFMENLKVTTVQVYKYDAAFLILPFCILIALTATLFMKETYAEAVDRRQETVGRRQNCCFAANPLCVGLSPVRRLIYSSNFNLRS